VNEELIIDFFGIFNNFGSLLTNLIEQ